MNKTITALAGLTLSAISASAATSRVEDVNNTLFTLTGTTTTVEGNNGTFAGTGKWTVTNGAISGTDRVATTVTTTVNNDFYINFGSVALGTIDVASNRYVEIFYNTSGDWAGLDATHALRLDTSNQAAAFVTFANRGPIPNGDATGPQSFIVDLDFEQDGDWTGNWTTLRWDFFNAAGNGGGKTMTIDKVVFGNTLTAVPEPSSTALLGLGGLALILRRRK
jgi:hypothetical protein